MPSKMEQGIGDLRQSQPLSRAHARAGTKWQELPIGGLALLLSFWPKAMYVTPVNLFGPVQSVDTRHNDIAFSYKDR